MINRMVIQKKGYTLIYVIMAMVLATLLANGLYVSVFLSNRLFMQMQRDKAAYYVAATGIEYGRYIIKSGHYSPDPTDISKWPDKGLGFDPSGGDGSVSKVTVSIEPIDYMIDIYTVNSSGRYSEVSKNIKVTCTSTGSIKSWEAS